MVRLESGVRVRQALVKHAVRTLKGGGLTALSMDAKTVSGVRVDVLAYAKNGESVAVICQAMVEPQWVKKRASQIRTDYIDKVVLCIPENASCPPIEGVEVWKADGVQTSKRIKVSGELYDDIEKLREELSTAAGRELEMEDAIRSLLGKTSSRRS